VYIANIAAMNMAERDDAQWTHPACGAIAPGSPETRINTGVLRSRAGGVPRRFLTLNGYTYRCPKIADVARAQRLQRAAHFRRRFLNAAEVNALAQIG
jgi:hypothetical protein